jgi:uncharacterized protein YggE
MRADLFAPTVRGLLAAAAAWLLCGFVTEALADPPDRFVAVSGWGEVLAEPDRATVTLGVEARNLELAAAREEVNRGVQKVLDLTRELRIEPERVQATRIAVRPEYDYTPQGEQRFRGYFVARQVVIDLRNLDQLGALLERSIDLGVNQVGDPELDSTQRRDLERKALALAVEDAKRNADALAHAAGATVGRVRTLSSALGGPVPMPYRERGIAMAADSKASDSYAAGAMSFTATVQAQYDLDVAGRSE